MSSERRRISCRPVRGVERDERARLRRRRRRRRRRGRRLWRARRPSTPSSRGRRTRASRARDRAARATSTARRVTMHAMRLSSRKAYERSPKTQAGKPSSAPSSEVERRAVGPVEVPPAASGRSSSGGRRRATIAGRAPTRPTPPATSCASSSASRSPTQSSVPSHGIRGWSQASHASRLPAGSRRGAMKKSWPDDEHARLGRPVGRERNELVQHLAARVPLAHADRRSRRRA